MTEPTEHAVAPWTERAKLGFGAFAIVGEFLLLAEHRAHASAYLTWLLLLARPLIHALIPHGHGEHDSGGHEYAFILSDSPPTSTTAAREDAAVFRRGGHHHGGADHMNDTPAYGLWSLVIVNSLVFIIFAASFTKPQSPWGCRAFGAFSAFLCHESNGIDVGPSVTACLEAFLHSGDDEPYPNAGHA